MEVGFGHLELLVDLGGLDDRHELAFVHVLADIDVEVLQVAVRAGVDGRVFEGLRVAGQGNLAGRAGNGGMDDVNGGHGLAHGGLLEALLGAGARKQAHSDGPKEGERK